MGGGGIDHGKLYFLLLKAVKCQEGPSGQRKVSQLIFCQLKGEVEVIFLFSMLTFFRNYHLNLNHVIIIFDSVISR